MPSVSVNDRAGGAPFFAAKPSWVAYLLRSSVFAKGGLFSTFLPLTGF